MSQPHVFHDPHGRRRRRVGAWTAAVGIGLAVVFTAFALSLFVTPLLPRVRKLSEGTRARPLVPRLPDATRRASLFLASRARHALDQQIANDRARRDAKRKAARPAPAGSDIVAAFYTPWEEVGLTSFRANAAKLTHVFPVWLHMDPANLGGFDASDFDPRRNSGNPAFLRIARENGVRIWPVLSNLQGDQPGVASVAKLLGSLPAQRRLATELRDWLVANHFEGINLDWEGLSAADSRRLPDFLLILRHTLHEAGLGLSIDLEAGNDDLDLGALAANVDLAIAMVYDEHYQGGKEGPIASIGWSQRVIRRFGDAIPENKLILAVGSYAYDWRRGRAGAESESYQAALKDAEGYRENDPASEVLTLEQDSLNTRFAYRDDDGHAHDVWLLDGVSAYNQVRIGRQVGIRGTALWALGTEDPSIWRFLDRSKTGDPNPRDLETVEFGPNDLEYRGQGELLYVEGKPTTATRRLQVDPDTGLIVDQSYSGYPSSTYIRRAGALGPKTIALSFDDGPDPTWTPQILDVLRHNRVPATFFVIGKSLEQYPEIGRREFAEGHEIGSHTFNHPDLDEVGDQRIELELNATQRVIEGIIGRSTVLFRPPFGADSEPTRPDDIHAIQIASNLGYVTVGEGLDPQDWRLGRNADDTGPRRAPQEIVDAVLYQLSQKDHGNILLMHDGGGDRSSTVAALKRLIPLLKAKGYRFVSVSSLLGTNRAGVMPAISTKDQALLGFDRVVFGSIFTFEWLLRFAFLTAIGLGLLRVLLIVPLAILRNRRHLRVDPTFRPPVSVLIAAFNEEKVIVRTVRSVLDSTYPIAEVVVVDDGSTDETFLTIVTAFAGDPRVVALRQDNGGKASALNRALAHARGDVLVCVDADTQLRRDAVGLLVQPFQDREIGAVAGNVKVGNVSNLLTVWQEIEYVTSQNIDRRAYALANGVSVCPGAVGAWRKSALVEAGGYVSDTLAEDMDLTWRLRRAGWRIETESAAIAYTEVPDTVSGFVRQRFRWAFGTIQCLWKHRRAIGRHGFFGWVTLPTLWLFQVVFQVLGPLVDLQLLYTSALFGLAFLSSSLYTKDWRPIADVQASLEQVAFLYGLFFVVELAAGMIAYRLERERMRSLWWLFLQRFVYRQIMYIVVYRSIVAAIKGRRQGWGKLDRKATVLPEEERESASRS